MKSKPVAVLGFLLLPLAVAAQDWPQFRGPGGQGHSTVKSLPLEWNDDSRNIAWKVPIDGLGWSSPVIGDGKLWLTTATREGKSMRVICLDAGTGKELLNVEAIRRDAAMKIHKKNSHASPTPILDGDRVYVHFGTYGTACLTTAGKRVWRQQLKYSHVHGPGGSPVLHGNSLYISCDGARDPFVVALHSRSGGIRWKTARRAVPQKRKFAFSTALVINVGGKDQVISPGAGRVSAYDPSSGRMIWTVQYPGGYSVVPRPVYGHGLVFVSSSFDRPRLLAIRPDGRGDVTETHVAWMTDRNAPHSPSPILVGNELYIVSDRGVATCLDAKTGKVHWQERLGGSFSASPLHAAGRIYFLDENGKTTVIEPGREYKELTRNEIKGRTLASLVPVEGALYLRTGTHLLRIETK